jgi:hypothetical protein
MSKQYEVLGTTANQKKKSGKAHASLAGNITIQTRICFTMHRPGIEPGAGRIILGSGDL